MTKEQMQHIAVKFAMMEIIEEYDRLLSLPNFSKKLVEMRLDIIKMELENLNNV